jgi:DNA-binding NarL/FixJ family response regulator
MLTGTAIRVMVVDDHPVVRDGVATQLGRHGDIIIAGHAGDAAEAVRVCARERPDIILLDLRLPDALAADIVPSLRSASPASRVLLFTAFPEHAAVAPALAAGACGVLVKDATGTALRDALREVARTGTYHGQDPAAATAPVTPREYDVLRLVASGHTNSEIGQQLDLSLNTVKAYLSNVMHKLGARNRAQVITNARAHGLLLICCPNSSPCQIGRLDGTDRIGHLVGRSPSTRPGLRTAGGVWGSKLCHWCWPGPLCAPLVTWPAAQPRTRLPRRHLPGASGAPRDVP